MRTKSTCVATILSLLWLAAGCHTPNVKPFGDAAAEMQSAVRQAYNTTWSRLDTYEALDKTTGGRVPRAASNHPANRFTNAWALRLQVMEAMVSYAESLANIVAASETSAANARAISDQAAKLVEATPWGVYGEAAKSIFQEVHGLAVSVARYRSIARAVNKADQAVQRSAEAIGKDMESLGRMLGPLYDDQEEGIIAKYNDHRSYFNAVTASRNEFEKRLLQRRDAANAGRLELLNARVAGKPQAEIDALAAKLQDAEANVKLVATAIKECDELLARVADQEKAFQSEMAASRTMRRASFNLVMSTREAIRLWAAAHRDLRSALAEKREPNVRLLVSSALEIRETIQQLKNP